MADALIRGSDQTWRLSPADRDLPAGRVLALVLGGHLADFRSHEAGVRAGGDVEALHRFRVALRRARSLMAVGAAVFPAEELELLRALGTWMMGVTSPVRDLDVLLGDMVALGERPSVELRDGVAPLVEALWARRVDVGAALLDVLEGERYQVLLRRWGVMSSAFRVGGGDPGPDALRPAGVVADELIWHAHRRLRRRAAVATSTDDRVAWHDLRKALKRFRYVVAGFAPMYPDGSFDPVMRRLSKLQDTLGGLQDHHVQAALIEEVGAQLGGRGGLAAGVIAESLHRDSEAAHARCRELWSDFDRPRLRRRLHDLVR